MHRHRIQHFIGQNQAGKAFRQTVQPDQTFEQMRRFRLEQRALPGLQIGADFENAVLRRQGLPAFQFAQQIERQTAAAGAQFEDVAAGCLQHRLGAARQRAAEQRRHFRRGDEIARRAELRRAAGVITQARRIQRQFHVAGERHPAAGAVDFGLDMGADIPAVAQRFRVGKRQFRGGGWSGHDGCASFGDES